MAPERPTVAAPEVFHLKRLVPLELLRALALRGIAKFFAYLTRTEGLSPGNAATERPLKE